MKSQAKDKNVYGHLSSLCDKFLMLKSTFTVPLLNLAKNPSFLSENPDPINKWNTCIPTVGYI